MLHQAIIEYRIFIYSIFNVHFLNCLDGVVAGSKTKEVVFTSAIHLRAEIHSSSSLHDTVCARLYIASISRWSATMKELRRFPKVFSLYICSYIPIFYLGIYIRLWQYSYKKGFAVFFNILEKFNIRMRKIFEERFVLIKRKHRIPLFITNAMRINVDLFYNVIQ